MNDQNAKQEPPKGYRLLTDEEKTKPLPDDALCLNRKYPQNGWLESSRKGEVRTDWQLEDFEYATRITPASTPADAPKDGKPDCERCFGYGWIIRPTEGVRCQCCAPTTNASIPLADATGEAVGKRLGDVSDWLMQKAKPTYASFVDDAKRRIATLTAELAKLKDELNWQNNRNSGHPTRGGFEFYINEEWTGIASAAIDTDPGWHAALRKKRIDPDDERVRIRRVAEDDALISELAEARKDGDALHDAITGILNIDKKQGGAITSMTDAELAEITEEIEAEPAKFTSGIYKDIAEQTRAIIALRKAMSARSAGTEGR